MNKDLDIISITTMLGCRLRLHPFEHKGVACYRLSLDVDSRHAEVLLGEEDLTAIVRGIREHDDR
jgi:hypothetical protein